MHPTEYNLDLLQEVLEDIEPFLLSPELFWPITAKPPKGSPPFPNLSLGGLLLTEDELIAQKDRMNPEQAARYSRLRLKRQGVWRKWLSTIQRKAVREMAMRCNLWRSYVVELEDQEKVKYDYPQEVRHLVMFERLADTAGKQPEAQELRESIRLLDDRLMGVTQTSEFIWDEQLGAIYPKRSFWFLFRSPRTN
jgi:hypothetical protein